MTLPAEIAALIAILFFLGIAGNVLYYFFPSSQAENPVLLAVDILDNQLTEISELDKIQIYFPNSKYSAKEISKNFPNVKIIFLKKALWKINIE